MNKSEYKLYQQQHIQNLSGCGPSLTYFSVYLPTMIAMVCAIMKRSKNSILKEYILIVIPSILCHTLLAAYMYLISVVVSLVFLIHVFTTQSINSKKVRIQLEDLNKVSKRKLASITIIRGVAYLVTQHCILSVDFKMFPRYLAKTENYGYSLMDTGVGFFVVSSGLVHKHHSDLKLSMLLKHNSKLVLLLLTFGIARFILVRAVDYQQHVSEYGVHWNFFYTLAVSKVISLMLLHLFEHKYTLGLAACILFLHQSLLCLGAERWVFETSLRESVISANKEGIVSNLGYVSLYIFGVYLSKTLKNSCLKRLSIIKNLMCLVVTFWVLHSLINHYLPSSRVLANAGYCIFTAAGVATTISILYYFESLGLKDFHVPEIVEAINDQGLMFFLLGNLLTGAINLMFYTLFIPTMVYLVIVNLYMVVTIMFVVYLNRKLKRKSVDNVIH